MTTKAGMCCWAVAVCLGFSFRVFAQDTNDVNALKKENAELRQRVDTLEKEMSEIKQKLGAQPAAPPAPAATLTEEQVAQLKKLAESKEKPVHSSLDLKLYGYIKLDTSYDDSRVSIGNYARWVESEATHGEDDQFNMTANQTRLGLLVTGPEIDGCKTGGKVEIDFYGSGTAENKPEPLLRHAYLTADWPAYRFGILAGQAADIISPLYPTTVNYTVGWWQGNIGYRRPQIRFTKGFELCKDWELKLEAGPSRTITGRKYLFTGATDPDSGTDAGFPTTQGRASLTFPVGGKRQATLGVSGHWGQEEQHKADPHTGDHICDTWSANVDLRVPLTRYLLLQAEVYMGSVIDSYFGGIGQGFDAAMGDCIHDRGGWVAATIEPSKKWQFNVGTGIDDVENGDVSVGSRTSNFVAFGNVIYSFNSFLQVAFEESYLNTAYKGAASGDALREQLAMILKF